VLTKIFIEEKSLIKVDRDLVSSNGLMESNIKEDGSVARPMDSASFMKKMEITFKEIS